jgi:hypothetical protein
VVSRLIEEDLAGGTCSSPADPRDRAGMKEPGSLATESKGVGVTGSPADRREHSAVMFGCRFENIRDCFSHACLPLQFMSSVFSYSAFQVRSG